MTTNNLPISLTISAYSTPLPLLLLAMTITNVPISLTISAYSTPLPLVFTSNDNK